MAIGQARYVNVGDGASAADIARLTQEIRQINARLDNHIGAGGLTAHRAATDQLAGFLSPADRARYEAAAAEQQASTGDALSSAGIYTGASSGVVGGVGVDETNRILDAINAVGPNGGTLIIRAANPADPIYLARPLQIETSNLTLIYASPLLYGPAAGQRINGGLKEILREHLGQIRQVKLRAPSTVDGDGRMVLPLAVGDGAWLQVGDRVIVRGENDKYGKAKTKQITTIIALSGDDAVCADEPFETFQPSYPDSEWPSDVTTGTTVAISAHSPMTADAAPGDIVLQVVNASIYTPGDLAYISDSRTEADMMAPVVTNLRSQCNMEIARIVEVDTTANTVTLDRALTRGFPMTWGAGVTIMAPVVNSHIICGRITWDAPQPDRKTAALAINYSDRCTLSADNINGISGRLGAAARVGYSFDCHIQKTHAYDAYGFASAEGYGLTLYYSTLCSIRDCVAVGGRHNYLIQSCTLWTVRDNYSGDDFISGIDAHGANSVHGRVTGNLVTRSKRYAPGVTMGGGIRIGNTSHTLGDHNTVISGNWIVGYLGAATHAGIDVSPSSRDTMIQGNTLVDCQIGLRHYKVNSSITPAQYADRITFSNNLLVRVAQPLDISNRDGNSYWSEVILRGNHAIDCPAGFLVADVPSVIFEGCRHDSGGAAVAFEAINVASLRVYGCSIGADVLVGAKATDCGTVKIVRNWFGDAAVSPIQDGGGNANLIASGNADDGGGGLSTIIDGGAFGDATTTTIDGGAFGDATSTTYDGGTF